MGNVAKVRLVRFAILACIVTAAAAVAMRFGPTRAVLFYASGRARPCSLSRAVASVAETRAQIATMERLSHTSRLVERDAADGLDLWTTEQGPFWIVSHDELRWFFLFLSEQDRNLYGKGEEGVRPGDIVLDCGAHYGLFTRRALKMGAKLVVAIEPAPQNLECLRRNLSVELAEGRVIAYPKGVWNQDASLDLSIDAHESGANSFVLQRRGPGTVRVPVTTIDKLVSELGLTRVDFIKMDIEGAERYALAGARQSLRKYRPRLSLATYHTPDDPAAIRRAVLAAEPRYQEACGACTDWGSYIRQEVVHYH